MSSQILSMLPFFIILALLTLTIIALATYRYMIARKEDFNVVHLSMKDQQESAQSAIGTRLSTIDRWGKTITIVTFIYFLIVAGVMSYREWVASSTKVMLN